MIVPPPHLNLLPPPVKKKQPKRGMSEEQQALRLEARIRRRKERNKAMRPCLGVYCQGKKKFLSTGPGNRQCPRCVAANAGMGVFT
jgi:hypothetical protein